VTDLGTEDIKAVFANGLLGCESGYSLSRVIEGRNDTVVINGKNAVANAVEYYGTYLF